MTWLFRVAYATVVGESLWLDIALYAGSNVMRQRLPMIWKEGGFWELEASFQAARLEYQYVLNREDGLELVEAGEARIWEAESEPKERVTFLDDWKSAGSKDRVYEAKIFEVFDKSVEVFEESSGWGNHEFNLHMTRFPVGLAPCLLGGIDALGDWQYDKALPMLEVAKNHWQARLNLPKDWEIEYKYGLYSSSENKALRLEGGENRVLGFREKADFVRVSDECFRRAADQRFRAAGVAIPLFSMRSERGCGVGEFADLKAMADWSAGTGLKMLQILPINDTTSSRTWTDSYPYSAISVYALHPIYLRLDEMTYPLENLQDFQTKRDELNRDKSLDYEAVMAVKWQFSRAVFDKNFKTISGDKAFLSFVKENRDWVLDYAVFSVKRDEFGTADFSQWESWAKYDSRKVEELSGNPEVLYFIWLQYELDRQLSAAVEYMYAVGVGLKGDLPIGVDRDSVDAWVAPHLFKMDFQTGAPPDAFSVKGQNWGFPTYNWDEMHKDGYAWWRSRFEKLSRYFDAYRIDHILGFFRIWQIPFEHVDGLMGCFEPALPVSLEDFQENGIEFDHDRFCKPYIREDLLKETFGEFTDGIRQDFLVDFGLGCYGLKADFSTQKGILDFFSKLKSGDWANHDWIRDALMELVGEVLFFEVEGSGGNEFHPRMEMAQTRSFKALETDVQDRLMILYEDYFYVKQEAFWQVKAYEKLPAMRSASNMLLCGEDLGMVPVCVPGVMSALGMLSLEIQRWPKIYGAAFSDPKLAPYMSVVSTGTHDMETLRAWWRDDEKVRSKFSWEMFGIAFPEKELSGEMARRIIAQHLDSPAMWAVFPLQDLLAMDENLRSHDIEGERINVPAITPYNWKWRMEITIQQLAEAGDFNRQLARLVEESGR